MEIFTKTGTRIQVFSGHLQSAFSLYQKNDPLRLAGATAFFANFALPPILLILIRMFGFFIDRKIMLNQLFDRLSTILEDSSIAQMREVLKNIRNIEHRWYATLLSFVFFLFVATTLFAVIKNSMDQIWSIGLKESSSFLFQLKNRGRSMVIIILAGFLFFVGILTDSFQTFIAAYIHTAAPEFGEFLLRMLNQFLFMVIVTVWFTVLFRFLTNGRPSWKYARMGGLLTGILFTLGKYILRIALPWSNIGNIYGASGSIVLIMLFVFYSSLIFYFGACYIKVLSEVDQNPIRPIKGAYNYEIKEVNSIP